MVIISTCYLALIMIKCLHKNKTFVQEHNFCLLRHFPESQSSVTLWSKYLIIFQYDEHKK